MRGGEVRRRAQVGGGAEVQTADVRRPHVQEVRVCNRVTSCASVIKCAGGEIM